MVSGFDVLNKIRSYLDGQINLDSFREWVVSSHLENNADENALRLLSEIEGKYAEFSDELIPENRWKNRLRALIAPQPQSAESFYLTFYYSFPSQSFPVSSSLSNAFDASNFNLASNYRPTPELDRCPT